MIKAIVQARQDGEAAQRGSTAAPAPPPPQPLPPSSPSIAMRKRPSASGGVGAPPSTALGTSPSRSGELPLFHHQPPPWARGAGVSEIRYPGRLLGLDEGAKGGRGHDGHEADDELEDRGGDSGGESDGGESGVDGRSSGQVGVHWYVPGGHSQTTGPGHNPHQYPFSAPAVAPTLQLGLGMPAVALHRPPALTTEEGRKQAGSKKIAQLTSAGKLGQIGGGDAEKEAEEEEVVVYFGIIDILQVLWRDKGGFQVCSETSRAPGGLVDNHMTRLWLTHS